MDETSASSRIFGIAAHIDAGKTTVSERMLHLAGIQHRPGRVDEGTTVLDWEEEERERGITIHSAAIHLEWCGNRYTLVDTPGHIDFTVEVERCMRVLDGVVVVFDAAQGVEAQTETVWRQAVENGVRRIGFLNKLDKIGADWDASVSSIEEKLGTVPLSLQVPIEVSEGRIRLLDLVEGRVLDYSYEGETSRCELRAPEGGEAERLDVERGSLVETLAERDEVLLDLYAEGRELPAEAVRAAIRRLTLAGEVFPVLGGAALRGVGVEPLLDAIAAYLPAPTEVAVPAARRRTKPGGRNRRGGDEAVELVLDPGKPLVARVFKVVATRHGPLSWVRLYQGTLEAGRQVRIPRLGRPMRVQGLWAIEADRRVQIERARAGEIVAVHGLPDVRTGDTICDRTDDVELEPWSFPEPVISMAVEPRSSSDRDRLLQALDMIAVEDPTMAWRLDEETGQILVSGMGQLHLEILATRLRKEFRLDFVSGRPRVAYRESLSAPVSVDRRIRRSLAGGREVDVRVALAFEPDPTVESPVVETAPGCPPAERGIPAALVERALEALRADLTGGFVHGYPAIRLRVLLRDLEGPEDGRTPSPEEVETACALLLRDLARRPEVCLLEPWMRVEVQVPEAHLSAILADLQAHGGEVGGIQVRGERAEVGGFAPLSKLLDYSTRIRSLTQGRATASLFLADWRPVTAPQGD